jgi:hypothetical protein
MVSTSIRSNTGLFAPGVSRLWLNIWKDISPYLVYEGRNYDKVMSINTTMGWLLFEVEKGQASWKEQLIRNRSTLFQQTLQLRFTGLMEEKRTQVKRLTQLCFLAIVKDLNGRYWLLGLDSGLRIREYGAGSSEAAYSLQLESLEIQQAVEINKTHLDNFQTGSTQMVDFLADDFNPNDFL